MKVILYLIAAAVVFVAYVRYLERKSVFYPARALSASPLDIGLPFEDVRIQTEDGVTLHGWLVKAPAAKAVLLYFHGNAGNIGDRLGKIDLFHRIGLNVLIVDYRGYGRSEGRPTEEGVYKDAAAAYDYLVARPDMQGQSVISYGASLGGAVAIDLALKRKTACLIADSTFSSAADMAKVIYPFVPSFLVRAKFDSIAKIKDVAVPQLFIHSVDDELVPFALGKKLYEAAPGPKTLIETGGTHNDGHIYDEDKVRGGITEFLRGLDLL